MVPTQREREEVEVEVKREEELQVRQEQSMEHTSPKALWSYRNDTVT